MCLWGFFYACTYIKLTLIIISEKTNKIFEKRHCFGNFLYHLNVVYKMLKLYRHIAFHPDQRTIYFWLRLRCMAAQTGGYMALDKFRTAMSAQMSITSFYRHLRKATAMGLIVRSGKKVRAISHRRIRTASNAYGSYYLEGKALDTFSTYTAFLLSAECAYMARYQQSKQKTKTNYITDRHGVRSKYREGEVNWTHFSDMAEQPVDLSSADYSVSRRFIQRSEIQSEAAFVALWRLSTSFGMSVSSASKKRREGAKNGFIQIYPQKLEVSYHEAKYSPLFDPKRFFKGRDGRYYIRLASKVVSGIKVSTKRPLYKTTTIII